MDTTSAAPVTMRPSSLPATTHMPVVLQPGDGEDGEILGEEADALRSGDATGATEGGKPRRRRSSNVFRCESCHKVRGPCSAACLPARPARRRVHRHVLTPQAFSALLPSPAQIYRHPSCLVKHRWQHSPAWQESSKFLVSKHQQVQMLEAATILVHLQPGSLPEDKSLWPAVISPQSHPMPSISFNDSRFISRQGTALSMSQSQRARQAHPPTPPPNVLGLRYPSPGGVSTGSGEETSVEGSSPPSSVEEEDVDGDLEMDFGDGDGHSPRKVRRPAKPRAPIEPAPSLAAARRPSFGTMTATMGNLALGSVPKSSTLSQQPSPAAYSPHLHSLGGFSVPSPTFASSSLLSRSLSGPASFGTPQPSYSPYSTSPALPHPSSSLRGGSFDEDAGLAGSPYTLGSRFRDFDHVVEEEEEDTAASRSTRHGAKEGSGEREDVYGLDTMDL